jgi:hypothetical protein
MRPDIWRDATLGTDMTGGQNKGRNEPYIHHNRYKYVYSFLAQSDRQKRIEDQ